MTIAIVLACIFIMLAIGIAVGELLAFRDEEVKLTEELVEALKRARRGLARERMEERADLRSEVDEAGLPGVLNAEQTAKYKRSAGQ